MTEELIERVARALAKADGKDPDAPAWVRYPRGETFGICWCDQYADKARAAIAAIQASQAVGERWQPIETAPKDGTDVLIWGPGHFVMIGRFTGLGSYSGPEWRSAWYGTPIAAEPSHWMPLPEAPALSTPVLPAIQTPSGEK